ncbi:MAG: efflux RND transporter permease subunit [Myxococcota bacterium]
MFETLARLMIRRGVAWAVVAATLVVAAASLYLARGVEHDDDLLAFLPEDNREIATFEAVNRRFGGLDMAIVGVEVDDAFDGEVLEGLRRATRDLAALPDLAHVLSLANVEDFRPDPVGGGIITGPLMSSIPRTEAEEAALRDKVMTRDHVVGNMVSEDGRGLQIFCTVGYEANPREAATAIKAVAREHLGDHATLHWGGNPFISSYIYDTTQEDMTRLTPWAVLAIVLIMVIAFRDLVGSCLALLSTGVGILVAIGAMALAGKPFNVVLGGMPVILFAVGSAYAIHVLTRYYIHVRRHPPGEAIVRTLTGIGPTVFAAGGTTMAGLLSFVMMDIEPIRTFGLFTALGIGATLVLSVTFVPAVVTLAGLRGRRPETSRFEVGLGRAVAGVRRHRVVVGVLLAVVAVAGGVFSGQVESRMDPQAFYSEGSPPDRADAFMREYFGGSQFMQLHVRGDMRDPHALREMERLADRIALLPEVTGVIHVGQVIALGNDAMGNERRVPDSRAKVALLFRFLSGQRSLRQLVSDERDEALVQIRMNTADAGESEAFLEEVEALVAAEAVEDYVVVDVDGPAAEAARRRKLDAVATRIRALARDRGVPLDEARVDELDEALGRLDAGADAGAIEDAVVRYLRGDEALVPLPEAKGDDDPAREVAREVVALGPQPGEDALQEAVDRAIGDDVDDVTVDDVAFSLETPLEEAWRQAGSNGKAAELISAIGMELPDGEAGERYRQAVAMALLDLRSDRVMLPAPEGAEDARHMEARVTGVPILHRGLSRSVTANQLRSLGFALTLVLLIMTALFRSLWSGLLATLPTALTLLVVYGTMGAFDVQLDIGTSMLASLIIGAGVDYAVHLMAAWRPPAAGSLEGTAACAAERTGGAIATNAFAVCAGFFVLTLGDAKPLQNVGGLTAAAMIAAALTTFLAIPALARKAAYTRTAEVGVAADEDAEQAEATLRTA